MLVKIYFEFCFLFLLQKGYIYLFSLINQTRQQHGIKRFFFFAAVRGALVSKIPMCVFYKQTKICSLSVTLGYFVLNNIFVFFFIQIQNNEYKKSWNINLVFLFYILFVIYISLHSTPYQNTGGDITSNSNRQ